MATSQTIKGLDRMLRRMDELKNKSAKKASRTAVTTVLKIVAKNVRKQVTAKPASTAVKRAARNTVGWRLVKKGTTLRGGKAMASFGKAGFGVGKQSKAKKAKASARAKGGHGVGIAAGSIHWFVLGTKERKHTSGHETGQIDAVLKKCVPAAVRGSAKPALREAAKKAAVVLRREAARLRSK